MRKFATAHGGVAVRETNGVGPAAVLIHGNSASSRAFARQLDGPLGASHRLVAIDLLGHGQSDDAADPSAYSLRGHAATVHSVIDALGLADAVIVGWSLGGHIALEMALDLPAARGFVIFGTPPLAFPPAMDKAFLPNPAVGIGFTEKVEREQAIAYAAAGFRPGFLEAPPSFVEDILRTDGRARAAAAASIAPGGYHDEVEVVASLTAPLAILHGAEDQLVNGAYFTTLRIPKLWREAVQVIPNSGHTPQWETPEAFDALLAAFLADTA